MEIADNLTVQGTLTATGGTSGGGAASGANLQKITTVAAAGATLGTATAISSAAREVYATATASTEGVKLPTAVTNTLIRVWASAAVGVKVYAAAAGQKIGAATTATTAVAIAKNTATSFLAINATNWLKSV